MALVGLLLVPLHSGRSVSANPSRNLERSPAATIAGAAAAAATGSDWTTYLGGPQRNSSSPSLRVLGPDTAANLTPAWTFSTGAAIVTQPILADGLLFVGAENGYEYALNPLTGAPRWSTFLGTTPGCGSQDGVSSTAAVVGGTLYVGGGDSYWYALNASNGSVLWKVFVGNNSLGTGGGNYNWASPLILGSYAYVGVASHCDNPLVRGGLLQVNLLQHRVVHRFNTTQGGQLGGSIWSSPSANAAGTVVYVTTGNAPANDSLGEAVIALSASNLRLLSSWHIPPNLRTPDGDFGTTPTVYTDAKGRQLVVATNKDGLTYAFNSANLAKGPVWKTRTASGQTFSSAAIGDGLLYVGSTTTRIGTKTVPGSLRALDPTTGAVRWALPWSGGVFAAPTYGNGLVAVGGGTLFQVVAAETGAPLFAFHIVHKTFQGAATLSADHVFVGANDGFVRAFALPPTVSIAMDRSSGVGPLSVGFSATGRGGTDPLTYAWQFGDGNGSTNGSARHTFAQPGAYTASVLVTDAMGLSARASVGITVYRPGPSVAIQANTTRGIAPLAVGLAVQITGGNAPFRVRWSFGDGDADDLNSSPAHVFATPGVYPVQVNVTDAAGLSVVATLDIQAFAPPALVGIALGPAGPNGTLGENFSAIISGGNAPFNESWTFGDGGSAYGPNTSHVYGRPGSYPVNLTVSDGAGFLATASENVTVGPPAPAIASLGAIAVAGNLSSFNFSATVTGGGPGLSYNWSFGDGSYSAATAPTHTYGATGNYTVALVVTDAWGRSVSASFVLNTSGGLAPRAPGAAVPVSTSPFVAGESTVSSRPRG